jgi:hypothetical protein
MNTRVETCSCTNLQSNHLFFIDRPRIFAPITSRSCLLPKVMYVCSLLSTAVFLPSPFPCTQSSLPRTRSSLLALVYALIWCCGFIPSWHASRSRYECDYVQWDWYTTVVLKLCCTKLQPFAGFAWAPSLATKFTFYEVILQIIFAGFWRSYNMKNQSACGLQSAKIRIVFEYSSFIFVRIV